ncbi:MAG: hydantoinase B/oxoprolinase family protein [Candidatus Aminicenantes bacterium]|nr:hydantoinase B/oxoprolinase family protein [Candidatus Aminicenantes bacterium]
MSKSHETEKKAAVLKMDPIRFEVMRSAFEAAADEMGAALRKAAYSTNIKTRSDFSCALFDSKLRIIAQSFSQPVHLASMSRMIPNTIRQYGIGKLRPGDALVMNHPYRGGVHLNDVAIMAPFFSGGKIHGYAATIAHHVDIGGYAPGGYCISTELYQEGIIIPPAKLVSEGEIVDDVFRLILANIRSPRQSTGDFRAQIAASLLGQKRMAEILSRFGAESVEIFVDELIEYTERWARAEISKLPDGVYETEALLDDDGVTDRPIRLALKVEIRKGRVSFDLTGSDDQRSSPMNATLTQTYSPLAYVVKCLIDSDIPTNEGFYRLIDVKAPAGTVVNATPPVGVVGGWEVVMRLCCLGFQALSDAMPDKVMASTKSINCHMACGGTDPRTGEYYTFIETMAGGWGGLPTKDGMDAVQSHIQNTENSAIEETENNLPFLITRYELIPDSEGAGRYRGGLGLRRDWKFPGHEATLTVFSDNRKFAPWGLFGGGSGSPSRYILNPDGEAKELPSKVTLQLQPGSVISYRTPGGGGYGTPLERDPERVLEDVAQGKVTPDRARDVYGVVLDPSGKAVDLQATRTRRGRLAGSRERR